MNRRITRETEMLSQARYRLGYSQQQVATRVGIHIRQYQRLEYGERDVRNVTMTQGLALCSVLKIDPYLLVFDGPYRAGEASGERLSAAQKPGKC